MFLTKTKSRRVKIIVACLALITTAAAAMAATVGWHGLLQSQRNSRILTRANQDLNINVGVECKEWVQRVVNSASGGVVTVPTNRSNTEWRSSTDCYKYPHPFNIEWVQPGQIIQMHWRNQSNPNQYPHTAIVLRKSNSGMTWIDSNWFGDRTVRTHTITFSQFRTCVGNRFNVYEIR